jgi:hypothetical protein
MLDMARIRRNPVALADLSIAMVLFHYFQVLAAKQSRSPHPFLVKSFQQRGSFTSKNCLHSRHHQQQSHHHHHRHCQIIQCQCCEQQSPLLHHGICSFVTRHKQLLQFL